jgi:hypothetical protein
MVCPRIAYRPENFGTTKSPAFLVLVNVLLIISSSIKPEYELKVGRPVACFVGDVTVLLHWS